MQDDFYLFFAIESFLIVVLQSLYPSSELGILKCKDLSSL
jgi:hypothetical protein